METMTFDQRYVVINLLMGRIYNYVQYVAWRTASCVDVYTTKIIEE